MSLSVKPSRREKTLSKTVVALISLFIICMVFMPIVSSAVYMSNVKIISPRTTTIVDEVTPIRVNSYVVTEKYTSVIIHPYEKCKWEVYHIHPHFESHYMDNFEIDVYFEDFGKYDIAVITTNESLEEGITFNNIPSYTSIDKITVEREETPTSAFGSYFALFIGLISVFITVIVAIISAYYTRRKA